MHNTIQQIRENNNVCRNKIKGERHQRRDLANAE